MRIHRTQGRGNKQTAALIERIERRGGSAFDAVMPAVSKMLRKVQQQGDSALLHYASKFDGLADSQSIRVTAEETAQAWEQIDPKVREALEVASSNIRSFAERQLPKSWNSNSSKARSGLTTGQLVRPLESAGCYVPGGRHPLPSTMLMTVIPAQVAGVVRIAVASPRPALETLATAHLLGVTEFYRMGGAHAIAALAYGTESVPRVTKIVGPGNSYVTAAKRAVAFDCAIDMLAGPTEIVVVSDLGEPLSIAADLVAQAEHDPEALAIFITANESLAEGVLKRSKILARRNATAREALNRSGYILLASTRAETHSICNRLAPEHLTIDSNEDIDWVRSAGSVFIGNYSPQPMGDYISGPNHTLPTGGMANVRGGLSVMDFVKLITVQQYTQAGLNELAPHALRLAEAEGLTGHAEAIRGRIQESSAEPKSSKRVKL